MATVIEWHSLRVALILQTVVLLAIMLVPLLVRERPPDAEVERPSALRVVVGLFEAFRLRSALLGAMLAVVVMFSTGILTAFSNVLFTQKLGWDGAEYARTIGGFGLWIGFAGAITGGLVADRVGHRRMAAIASIALGVCWLVFAAGQPWWGDDRFVYALFALEPLCQSMLSVSLFALYMRIASPRVAGSQFAAYMALINVGSTLGFRRAGAISDALGDAGVYALAGALQIAIVAILPFIDPGETRRKLAA